MTLRAVANVPNYLGSFTYATLPSASANSGLEAFASDWGVNGTKVRSNGTRWLPINGQTVLKRMGAAVSAIANTETIVIQTQLPIGALQTGRHDLHQGIGEQLGGDRYLAVDGSVGERRARRRIPP
jgi:hypothetical protein